MTLAPIVLFVYNRPWHTQQTLEALSRNKLADKSKLYIYADGAKSNATIGERQKIHEVYEIVTSRKWCGEQEFVKRNRNFGLADNIVDGVTTIVNKYRKIIVLEDDIETSKGFLEFMNLGLEIYKLDYNVKSISGYIEPIRHKLKYPVFLTKGTSWGWATWKRVWDEIEWDIETLINEFNNNKELIKILNFANIPYYDMLKLQQEGKINSWAIRFYASCILKNGLHLTPQCSLVNNTGFDGTGVHCKQEKEFVHSKFNVDQMIKLKKIDIIVNQSFPRSLQKSKNNGKNVSNFKKKIKKILTNCENIIRG